MSRRQGRSHSGRAEDPGAAAQGHPGRVTLLDLSDETGFKPLSDVAEADDSVRIRLELPGVPPASVQVRVRGDCLEVSGEKVQDLPQGEASYLCLERIFGRFRRVFEVVGAVNLAQVSARMRDGILEVTIPKVRERRGRERHIPVTEG
ncbi:MAG TPA: Hsp20/alpha crystallin family protein [Candidatus Deferrimicrobiaceae bacterium]